MTTRVMLLVAGMAVVGGVLFAKVFVNSPRRAKVVASVAEDVDAPRVLRPTGRVDVEPAPVAEGPTVGHPTSAPVVEVVPPPAPVVAKPKKVAKAGVAAAPAQPKVSKAEAEAHPAVPGARVALSFVGMVPEAEVVWLSTINDPTVPAEARKDLIEDLNEDGFADPKHVTEEDVPLILSRLDLIEQFGPEAMDETNAAAFAEAYKDLVGMLGKVGR